MTVDEFRLRDIAVAAFGPSILFGLATGAILPIIAISAIDKGASVALASLVVSLIGIGSIASNIPAGVLAARFGERRSMVWAAGISMLGLALCLIFPQLWIFAAGVLLLGAASSVFNLARQAYLTDAVPMHMRARAMSTLGGSMRIGVFVGPFLSAAAIHFVGLPGAYYVSLVSTLAGGILAFKVPDLEHQVEPGAGTVGVPGSLPETLSTWQIVKRYRRTFATLGLGVLLLSAIRATRQVVIPLWSVHLGLNPSTASIIYGIAGAIDMLTFYPAGKVMDRRGRRWVAVPSMLIMGASMVLMPLTTAVIPLVIVSMLMGFGNGIGSGIVMTLGADAAPPTGRHRFFGVWRELSDTGAGIGPVVLSFVTAIASLSAGIVVSGLVGFAAAAALLRWIPRHHALLGSPERAGPHTAGPDEPGLPGA